jgi:hypothetical protein
LLPASPDDNAISKDSGTPLRAMNGTDAENTQLNGTRQFEIPLQRPQIGSFAVRIQYRLPRPNGVSANGDWPLPIIQPVDARISATRATVQAPRNLAVSLAVDESSSWKSTAASTNSGDGGNSYEFVAEGDIASLPLVVNAAEINMPSTTIVERAWLQTWLTRDMRQDRAAFRFRTAGSQTTIELPPDATAGEIEVLIDQRPAEVQSGGTGRLVVRLPASRTAATDGQARSAEVHTLELRSRRAIRSGLLTIHRLTPPQLDGTTALSQIYWQIILPSDEHMVRSPRQLIAASQWQWLNTFWGRRPIQTQPELEQWVGASTQMESSAAQNEYLFTGLLPVSSIDLVTAPRWLVVLISSASVLAMALLLIYAPQKRRSWLLIAAASIIAALAIAYPAAAFLVAQASTLGLILSVFSILISRLMRRPTLMPIPLATSSTQRVLVPRSESIVMPPLTSAASTAPTASLRISE